jgi:RNA polymerase primary sigma factor
LPVEDKYNEVTKLIAVGKERGYLLYDEIFDLLPEGIDSSCELDDFFSLLGSQGIEVIDTHQDFQNERGNDCGRNENHRDDGNFEISSLQLDKTIDLAHLYFREMAPVPLLTRESEIEIAKRIEHGREMIAQAVSRSPLIIREILNIAEKPKKNHISIRHVVSFSDEEISSEDPKEKASFVLSAMESIRRHEQAAQKIYSRFRRCRRDSRLYKKNLAMLARHRIPIARKIRNLDLWNTYLDRFVGIIKAATDRAIACDCEINRLKKGLQKSHQDGDANVIEAKIERLKNKLRRMEN